MRKFNQDELRVFLTATDACMEGEEEIVLVGGAAIALIGDVNYGTEDIDTWGDVSRSLIHSFSCARTVTGLDVPVERAGVIDPPDRFEDRVVRILPELEHLTVFVLDLHDVALSKMVRGHKKDFDAIWRLHKNKVLDKDILFNRYANEMTAVVGNPRAIDQHFLRLIDMLYGDAEAERVRLILNRDPPLPPMRNHGRY